MKNTMLSPLNPEEMDYLTKHFRLTTNISPDPKFSVPSINLLDETKCLAYLDRVRGIFQSSSTLVTASQFSKRYSFLAIAPSLYAMTMFNKGLDFCAENCMIESAYQDKTWLPKVRLTNWLVTPHIDGNRHEWRDHIIKNIFAGNIAKVWRAISKAGNIPMAILWENTAIYVYWLYEKRIGEEASDQQISRVHEDFQYLLSEAPASLFGEKENPLGRYFSPQITTTSSSQEVRIRKTCCYYYQISPNKDYCSTCPKI
jgi:ferric iron reductase protein FhuF